MTRSEFGKGLCYCLGLFLCHSERERLYNKEVAKKLNYSEEQAGKRNAKMWFNGASDHLYDLQIPENLPVSLKKRLAEVCKKAIHWGHGFDSNDQPTEEDKKWAIQEAKDLLRLIDEHFGVETQKGDWE